MADVGMVLGWCRPIPAELPKNYQMWIINHEISPSTCETCTGYSNISVKFRIWTMMGSSHSQALVHLDVGQSVVAQLLQICATSMVLPQHLPECSQRVLGGVTKEQVRVVFRYIIWDEGARRSAMSRSCWTTEVRCWTKMGWNMYLAPETRFRRLLNHLLSISKKAGIVYGHKSQ